MCKAKPSQGFAVRRVKSDSSALLNVTVSYSFFLEEGDTSQTGC